MESPDLVSPQRAQVRPNHIPVGWLLLDLAGMALLGTGFAVLLGKLTISADISSQVAGWGLIATGLFSMLPLYLKILKAVRHYRQEDQAFIRSLEEARQSRPRDRNA
ncbi:MAG TPA: hypothetical protein VFW42_10115 [Fluviicoccus sp.]|nr:hypothetical protein [Fluviicoccus sp.]